MINGDALAGVKMLLLQGSLAVRIRGFVGSWSRPADLLPKLTCCALWKVLEAGTGCVEKAGSGGVCKRTRLHEKLDPSKADMPKLVMPAKQLFLSSSEVVVVVVNRGDGSVESMVTGWKILGSKGC